MNKGKIMLVDDSVTNLMIGKNVLQDTYEVLTVPSGEKALALLERVIPDLILLDIEMPEMSGYETLEKIKGNPATAEIPVIFLTARSDAESEYDGLSMGAVDYIAKPFSIPLLKKRIELHLLIEEQQKRLREYNENLQKMVEQKTKQVVRLQDGIIMTMAELVEYRDGTTGGHIERTQNYLRVLVEELMTRDVYSNITKGWDINLLVRSAPLHDVGKISVPDSILNKVERLSEEEFTQMKNHTILGKEAIERISDKVEESEFLQQAAILAYSHHERWDGTGYPQGLKGEEIPLQGRLMAIADVYDALVSVRTYKKSFTHDEAVEMMIKGSGTQFDPRLIGIFMDIADKFQTISAEWS